MNTKLVMLGLSALLVGWSGRTLPVPAFTLASSMADCCEHGINGWSYGFYVPEKIGQHLACYL